MQYSEYDQFLNGAVFLRQENAGYLRVSGPDTPAFLQRQTTNDVQQMTEQTALLNTLLSATARLVDVFYVVPESPAGGEALGLLTLIDRGDRSFQYLKSRIFFMDKVEVANLSSNFTHIDLFGRSADQVLQRLQTPNPPEPGEIILGNSIAPGGNIAQGVRLLRHNPQIGFGYRLLVPAEFQEELFASLVGAGAQPVSEETYHLVRIEAGIPGPGRELGEEYTPLEANLSSAISSTKGCYTGQEVIARQLTYDKVTRRLVGLRLDAPSSPGASLKVDGKPAGKITSFASSPRLGPIALGVVKRPFDAAGQSLLADNSTTATVTELPF